jgi:PAS domain S-box-containing protein
MVTEPGVSFRGVPIIAAFLTALVIILFALAVLALRASPRAWANRSLACGALAGGVWIMGVCGLQTGTDLRFWLAVAFAGASFIPAALLQLVRHYPVTTPSPSPAVVLAALVLAAAFAVCAAAPSLLFARPRLVAGALVRDPGPLYPLFVAYFLLGWVLAIVAFARKWSLATAKQRTQLRYFGTGVILSAAGGITTNLLVPYFTGNSSYYWLGPCFVVPFVVFAAHSIVRHHLMDLRLVLHERVLATLASAVALAPLLAVVALVASRADGEREVDGSAIALLVLAGLSIPLARDVCRRLLDRYVYRAQANYRQTVRDSSALLTRGQTVRSLMEALARHVLDATHPEGVAIYLGQDREIARTAMQAMEESRFRAPDALPSTIVDALPGSAGGLWAQSQEPLRPTTRRPVLDALLAELHWALVLPLRAHDGVIGAIALGPKRSGDAYYPHDLDLLATLANQAGIAVKSAQLSAEVVLANEYVQNIVATINSGVVAIDAAGRITLFNRAAERLTGLSAADLLRQPTSALPACLGEPLARTVIDGAAITYPEIGLGGEATARPVICTVSPLRDPTGSALGAVAVFSDLTPLKELEIERRRTEKLDYFKLLASGFAHEIRNPLVSIKTFVQLVPHRLGDGRWLEGFSRVAHREIERLERLLSRLATLGRASGRPHGPLDLRLPVGEALELVQPEFAERRIRVDARLGELDQTILGDRDELTQLVHNLLVNALHATPVGGELTVELGPVGNRAVLTVADTGPGIPPEMLERIFDPFVTTRQNGTGLGLAICIGIAAAHRARLHAANRAAGGAMFTVEFPLGSSVPAAEPVAPGRSSLLP